MLTLIIGGARSGKSSLAQRLARVSGNDVTYIATAEAGDEEMSRRIQKHRCSRPQDWVTIEEPRNLSRAFCRADSQVVLLDCLSMWISNRLLKMQNRCDSLDEENFLNQLWCECQESLKYLTQRSQTAVVVTNEVGCSLVPPNRLGRTYRDLLGSLNQKVAGRAERVVLMTAGIATVIKGSPLPQLEVE